MIPSSFCLLLFQYVEMCVMRIVCYNVYNLNEIRNARTISTYRPDGKHFFLSYASTFRFLLFRRANAASLLCLRLSLVRHPIDNRKNKTKNKLEGKISCSRLKLSQRITTFKNSMEFLLLLISLNEN